MQQITSALAENKNLNLTAQWEHKTDKIIQKQVVKGRLNDLRRQQAATLEQRREKLAMLLAAEDRMYEQEFNDKQETPE